MPEAWLRGPIPGIDPLLMPAAHALVQAREELQRAADGLTAAELWARPGGAASVGFHLRHVAGSIDRLLTYARGETLTHEQLNALGTEGKCPEPTCRVQDLVQTFERQVDKALEQLRHTDEATLTEARGVGRAQLPSTVLGLLMHAAEHTMRHVGQLSVTSRVVV